jgi:hypothetical protein
MLEGSGWKGGRAERNPKIVYIYFRSLTPHP